MGKTVYAPHSIVDFGRSTGVHRGSTIGSPIYNANPTSEARFNHHFLRSLEAAFRKSTSGWKKSGPLVMLMHADRPYFSAIIDRFTADKYGPQLRREMEVLLSDCPTVHPDLPFVERETELFCK